MTKNKVQTVVYLSNAQKEKQFLLLQMNEKRKLYWQNITGGVEQNESFIAAAKREAVEETNIDEENIEELTETDLEFKFIDQWDNSVVEKVFFLRAKKKWEIKLDPKEHINYKWLHESEVQRECVHYESNFIALKKAMQ